MSTKKYNKINYLENQTYMKDYNNFFVDNFQNNNTLFQSDEKCDNFFNNDNNNDGQAHEFPFDINFVDDETNKELLHYFKGERTGFVQVGPKKWFFPSKYIEDGKHFYNFHVRPDDTWVVTFPRSGTTLTQELVWLISNNVDIETAKNIELSDRFPFLEFSTFVHDDIKKELLLANAHSEERMQAIEEISVPGWKSVAKMKSPRFIKTHLPFSLLPKNILNSGCKIIYVARNPKDVVVSFYHLNRLFKTQGYIGDFETYWSFFKRNLHPWMPYWEHVQEGWDRRHDPNVLFCFYEEMNKDMPKCIKRIANFLNKSLTEEQIEKLTEHVSIKNFNQNKAINSEYLKDLGICYADKETGFVRQGKIDGWQTEFSSELRKEAEEWIQEHLNLTDFKFPI